MAIVQILIRLSVASAILIGPFVSAQDTGPQEGQESQCIDTDNIKSYKIETDDLVRFYMHSGDPITMRLKRHCPQLRFHGYLSYTPTNGKLCAGVDEITTRSGLPCRINSLLPAKPMPKPASLQ